MSPDMIRLCEAVDAVVHGSGCYLDAVGSQQVVLAVLKALKEQPHTRRLDPNINPVCAIIQSTLIDDIIAEAAHGR